ncbi:MAG: phage tail tube protein [Patescibacteria group bacterium]
MPSTFTWKSKFALQKESVYNTYASSGIGAKGLYIYPETKPPKTDQPNMRELLNRQQPLTNVNDNKKGLKTWDHTIIFPFPKEAMGDILQAVFGTTVLGTAVSGFYPHIFTIKDGTPPSLSLCHKDGNREWQLAGGMVRSLNIAIQIGKAIQSKLILVGGKFTDIAETTPISVYVPTGEINEWLAQSSSAIFQINSVTYALDNVEFNFENALLDGVNESYGGGSEDRIALERTTMRITGKFSAKYTDATTLYALANAGTVIPITFQIGTLGGAYGLKITLSKCVLDYPEKGDREGLVYEDFTFEGQWDSAIATEVKIETYDKQAWPASS